MSDIDPTRGFCTRRKALENMRKRPDLLSVSRSHLRQRYHVYRLQHTPGDYERRFYYNGIAGDDDHPVLVYRSTFATPFPKPADRFAYVPVKSLRGVHGTRLLVSGRPSTLLASSPTDRLERKSRKNGVEDAVIEWRESVIVVQKLVDKL
ncbi:hypothetical protein DL96DRAFT_1555564 [Flagelloscypha sp. PMI_526]|nr:hypothetical protein DL96DRAFT_1555564 [Flagelloscypha sp. PMI_526]